MKTRRQIFRPAALVSFVLLMLHSPTIAAPPIAAPVPYRLTLSLSASSASRLTLNLLNSTPHTLFFAWAPGVEPIMQFEIGYKAPTDDPCLNTGWKLIAPYPKPAPDPNALGHGVIIESTEMRIKMLLAPGQDCTLPVSPDFPMSTPGFYRITLTMTIPHAASLDGPVGAPTKIRRFVLVLHGGPLVIRQTSSGFVAVAQKL